MQPQALPVQLAGNPTRNPIYGKTIKGQDGPLTVVDPRATRALVSLMDMNAVLGGAASHYGGPAAFAELMSALHGYVFWEAGKKSEPWHRLFHLINDAGHCENGLYALKANYEMAGLNFEKLKKFRSIESSLTGHGEGHLFPEGVYLSNGPLGSAFPQSQGLAMAEALSGQNRVTVTAISDGACMEGEAREAMAAIPGLAKTGKMGPFVLVISDNNTKLSGRIDKDSFSMEPTFDSLTALGWKVLSLPDGHDLQECYNVIAQAVTEVRSAPQVPIAIHAKTIKGIGTQKTAESSSGGHGFPLKSSVELPAFLREIYDGEYPPEFQTWIDELIELEKKIKANAVKPAVPEEKIQVGISSAMVKAAKAGLPILSITSDLPGSTGVATFRKEFPQHCFDVGVAESNMVSVAAGMSKVGFIPVVDTFAQFGVTKGALPLTMASLSDAPMICVFSHTGFQDAADGASHQALSYLAMVSSIPNVEVYCLTCSEEAEALMSQAIEQFVETRKQGKTPPSFVFFLGRENFPKKFQEGAKYELRKAQVLQEKLNEKQAVTIVASGSCLVQATKASDLLQSQGIGSIVINPGCHNHIDTVTISEALKKTQGQLITVEDHQWIGGFGQMLTASLARESVPFQVRSLAVHGEFGQSAYLADELYHKHKIDAVAIVDAAAKMLNRV
ncbi:MAG: transketolase [Bdellovibrio sp. CG10_big_fil_rev_8_21_14_0_10_47_8]|nr:MAG: transketolase [Bdellovibrio sp. CG10_big_fil_rev_8_21_14_0_10_47_8]